MRRVALIQNPSSKYGVLGAMTEALASAFARKGIEVSIHGLHESADSYSGKIPDCTWGINALLDETVLFRPFGVPHVDLSVDTCIHTIPSALRQPHLVQLFVDKESCELFASLGGRRTLWFPHAIAKEVFSSQPCIPLDNRTYDAAVIGSCFLKSAWLGSSEAGQRLQGVIDQALADLSYPFFSGALSAIREIPELKSVDAVGLLTLLETALRHADRDRLLRALRGRTVHIFTGADDAAAWTKQESARGSVFHPPVDFRDVIRVCCQSKVVINSSPHIRRGYHERLFLSLASGAITLVERGRLPSWLVEEGRVVEYDTASLESVEDRLIEAQCRPYNRQKVLSWLSSDHTWDARLAKILPAVEDLLETIKDNR